MMNEHSDSLDQIAYSSGYKDTKYWLNGVVDQITHLNSKIQASYERGVISAYIAHYFGVSLEISR